MESINESSGRRTNNYVEQYFIPFVSKRANDLSTLGRRKLKRNLFRYYLDRFRRRLKLSPISVVRNFDDFSERRYIVLGGAGQRSYILTFRKRYRHPSDTRYGLKTVRKSARFPLFFAISFGFVCSRRFFTLRNRPIHLTIN